MTNLFKFSGFLYRTLTIWNAVICNLDFSSDFRLLQSLLQSLWGPLQVRQLLSTSPSPACSTVSLYFFFLVLWQGSSICLSFRFLLFSHHCLLKENIFVFVFVFCSLALCLVLHDSMWLTLPTQSCQVLYSFCTSFLHPSTLGLIVSSLSLHNLHVLFCCMLSISALT